MLMNTVMIEDEQLKGKSIHPIANEGLSAFSGLKYFRALIEGSLARPPMLELFDINIEAAAPERGLPGHLQARHGRRHPCRSCCLPLHSLGPGMSVAHLS